MVFVNFVIIKIVALDNRWLLDSGFRVSIKELLKPSEILRVCVDKRNPKLAIR